MRARQARALAARRPTARLARAPLLQGTINMVCNPAATVTAGRKRDVKGASGGNATAQLVLTHPPLHLQKHLVVSIYNTILSKGLQAEHTMDKIRRGTV